MSGGYNLCIIKPNKSAFSETFIQEHIDRLAGNKKVLYGGAFPVYDDKGDYLIKSKIDLLSYLIQKKLFKKQDIKVRTNALVKYLKSNKIDVVFAESANLHASVTEACKLAGVPLVIQFHGADVHHRPTVAKYHELYLKAFEYASAFIAVSGDMVKELIKLGAPADKVFYNSCGVDTAKFAPVDVEHSKHNILAIGRFVNKKAPMLTIKTFKLVVEQVPDAHMWMVGRGPLLEAAEQTAIDLGLAGQVTFTGVLPSQQIIELMKQMRCFVQHSVTAKDGDMEGTPVTVLEAAAAGLPIVSTAHAGIKEAVVDGVTGFLVAEHDVKSMAEKMVFLISSPQFAAQMGKAGHDHIIKNYELTDRIKTIDSIIQNALKK
jgi:colanic acid/amylovoran biosynthesis glycosyltransferase